jgi:hypothetical protein
MEAQKQTKLERQALHDLPADRTLTEYASKRVRAGIGWWMFGQTRDVKVALPKEQVVEDYQLVDTTKDILAETRSAMIKAGLHVYVFEQTPSGLVSTEGEPLHQVMDRCKARRGASGASGGHAAGHREVANRQRLV